MRALAARTWADFRSHWRTPLAYHLAMQLLGVALFTPIVSWVGRHIVLVAGEPVISNYDIAKFVLSVPGVAFGLVVAALTVALVLAEFAGHSWIAGNAIARRRATLASTAATVLRAPPRLVVLSDVFLRFASPEPAAFLEAAHLVRDEADADFLWEAAGTEEFGQGGLGGSVPVLLVDLSGLAYMDVRVNQSGEFEHFHILTQKKRAAKSDSLVSEKWNTCPNVV